ncbi:hypothetical protein K491DRAFT_755879 [Lophiostoma macrostomum CBS 122681]|uniref:Uncharacterized protein n=1 Tax=Lophiostoma macrostomum CBS 122681 TaxID=1314788 RepID=A0A6A6TFP0_9PLEO|nr:hypothetical protein K491DRAFT_755879 [Lophiostoma macrostomum CBS 122681]
MRVCYIAHMPGAGHGSRRTGKSLRVLSQRCSRTLGHTPNSRAGYTWLAGDRHGSGSRAAETPPFTAVRLQVARSLTATGGGELVLLRAMACRAFDCIQRACSESGICRASKTAGEMGLPQRSFARVLANDCALCTPPAPDPPRLASTIPMVWLVDVDCHSATDYRAHTSRLTVGEDAHRKGLPCAQCPMGKSRSPSPQRDIITGCYMQDTTIARSSTYLGYHALDTRRRSLLVSIL